MSIKLRKDCPTYPTVVKDGVLTVYLGSGQFNVSLPFFTEDYPLENSYFPVSGIMGYFDNGETKVVMRFDGTVTKFTRDDFVIGMCKFDPALIYKNVTTLPVGYVIDGGKNDRVAYDCYIRILKDSDVCTFECTNDPEAIQFYADKNPQFCCDLVKGNRISPALVKIGVNTYADELGAYVIESHPIKYTSVLDI